MGSSSDDWILLAAQLQPLLITLIHSAIAIPHILQSLFTLIHWVYFQQSSSPTAYSLNTLTALMHWLLALRLHSDLLHYADSLHITTLTTTDLIQSQSQSYFTTGDLPPISSSWRQAPWDPTTRFFFSPELLR
jgi:hypothetical protein